MPQFTALHALAERAGARFIEVADWSVPADFGDWVREYWETLRGASLFDLSARGKLEVSGNDAPDFLHNLCTNDVTSLPLGGGCEAFFTNDKAKTIAQAWIYHVRLGGQRDALWLDVEPGRVDPLIKHLDHFLISEQVDFSDRTAEFSQLHLAGPKAAAILETVLGEPLPEFGPFEHMERTLGEHSTCHIRRFDRLGVPGYDLVCLNARATDVWDRLTRAGAAPAGAQAFDVLRIEAGSPIYGIDIEENRFVSEIGRAHAISFTKGCFLGQEPIVMARDRAGFVNRSFQGLKFEPASAVAPGTLLLADNGKEAGLVTSVAQSPRFGSIGLGYIRRGHETAGNRLAVKGAEPAVTATVVPLPFREG